METSGRPSQFANASLELRSLILSGAYEQNSRMPEIGLAGRIGIFRTLLRQALARLVEQGLLERHEIGRWRVASCSTDDIADVLSRFAALLKEPLHALQLSVVPPLSLQSDAARCSPASTPPSRAKSGQVLVPRHS